jgi:UDP-glucose 4-epimerase
VAAIQQRAEGGLQVVDKPRRTGDPAAAWADINRAQRVLGWTPSHDLQSIVDTAWRWHMRQMAITRSKDPPSRQSPESSKSE